MHYKEILQEVKMRTGSADCTEAVLEASIETLGERLREADRDQLGAQLPKELKAVLGRRPKEEFFSLEEFYNRVSARAHIGYPDAVRWSRVVMGVMGEVVTVGLMQKILENLPAQYGELFGQEPTTPLSPTIE